MKFNVSVAALVAAAGAFSYGSVVRAQSVATTTGIQLGQDENLTIPVGITVSNTSSTTVDAVNLAAGTTGPGTIPLRTINVHGSIFATGDNTVQAIGGAGGINAANDVSNDNVTINVSASGSIERELVNGGRAIVLRNNITVNNSGTITARHRAIDADANLTVNNSGSIISERQNAVFVNDTTVSSNRLTITNSGELIAQTRARGASIVGSGTATARLNVTNTNTNSGTITGAGTISGGGNGLYAYAGRAYLSLTGGLPMMKPDAIGQTASPYPLGFSGAITQTAVDQYGDAISVVGAYTASAVIFVAENGRISNAGYGSAINVGGNDFAQLFLDNSGTVYSTNVARDATIRVASDGTSSVTITNRSGGSITSENDAAIFVSAETNSVIQAGASAAASPFGPSVTTVNNDSTMSTGYVGVTKSDATGVVVVNSPNGSIINNGLNNASATISAPATHALRLTGTDAGYGHVITNSGTIEAQPNGRNGASFNASAIYMVTDEPGQNFNVAVTNNEGARIESRGNLISADSGAYSPTASNISITNSGDLISDRGSLVKNENRSAQSARISLTNNSTGYISTRQRFVRADVDSTSGTISLNVANEGYMSNSGTDLGGFRLFGSYVGFDLTNAQSATIRVEGDLFSARARGANNDVTINVGEYGFMNEGELRSYSGSVLNLTEEGDSGSSRAQSVTATLTNAATGKIYAYGSAIEVYAQSASLDFTNSGLARSYNSTTISLNGSNTYASVTNTETGMIKADNGTAISLNGEYSALTSVTNSGQIEGGSGGVSIYAGTANDITVTNSGSGTISTTAGGNRAASDLSGAGFRRYGQAAVAIRTGRYADTVTVTNGSDASITGVRNAIDVQVNGSVNAVSITNEGTVTTTGQPPLQVGDGIAEVQSLSSEYAAISAFAKNAQSMTVNNSGNITTDTGYGINLSSNARGLIWMGTGGPGEVLGQDVMQLEQPTVTVDNPGSISSYETGVQVVTGQQVATTITNSSDITSTYGDGIDVTRYGGLRIIPIFPDMLGGIGEVVEMGDPVVAGITISNSGTINAADGAGISVIAAGRSIFLNGPEQEAAEIPAEPFVTVDNTGTVISGDAGIYADVAAIVTNSGDITASSEGSGGVAVGGGSVTNTGTITGAAFGVVTVGQPDAPQSTTLDIGTGPTDYAAASALTVENTGTISGGLIGIQTKGEFDDIVVNDGGTISGATSALALDLGNDSVTAKGAAVFTGSVDGGGGTDMLTLDGFTGGSFTPVSFEQVDAINGTMLMLDAVTTFGGGALTIDASSVIDASSANNGLVFDTVANSGRLNLQDGATGDTLAVTGALTSLGTIAIDVDPSTGTQDAVTAGGAAAASGTLDVALLSLSVKDSEHVVITGTGGADATGLLLNTTDTAVTAFALRDDGNDIVLVISTDFAPAGLADTGTAFGQYLNANADDPAVFPILAAAQQTTNADELQSLFNNLNGSDLSVFNTSAATGSGSFGSGLFSCAVGEGEFAAIDEGQCGWTRISGSYFDRDTSGANPGFDEKAFSVSAGGQFIYDDNIRLGAGVGIDIIDTDGSFGLDADTTRIHAGVSAKYVEGPMMAGVSVSGGMSFSDSRRTTGFGQAKADFETFDFSVLARAAYLADLGNGVYVKPQVQAGVTYVDRGSFTETGAGAANLAVSSNSQTYFSVSPSVEIGTEFEAQGFTVRPYLRAGATILSEDNVKTTARVAGTAAAGTFTTVTQTDNVFGDVAAGANIFTKGDFSLRAEYQGRFSEDTMEHGGFVKLQVKF